MNQGHIENLEYCSNKSATMHNSHCAVAINFSASHEIILRNQKKKNVTQRMEPGLPAPRHEHRLTLHHSLYKIKPCPSEAFIPFRLALSSNCALQPQCGTSWRPVDAVGPSAVNIGNYISNTVGMPFIPASSPYSCPARIYKTRDTGTFKKPGTFKSNTVHFH